MTERVAANLSLENRLRLAIEREEFVLHYQPRVGLATGRVEGLEALIRWQSPDGLVPPGQFVPLLEETGLILQVGSWALREAAVCLYTNTPDRHFVLDQDREQPDVWLLSACSGHGFKFAPALAELLVAAMTGRGGPAHQLFAASRLA